MPRYVNERGQLKGWEDVLDDVQEAVKTGSDVIDTGQDIYRKYGGGAGSSPASSDNSGVVPPPDVSATTNSAVPPPNIDYSGGISINSEKDTGIPTWAIILGACVVGYLILK